MSLLSRVCASPSPVRGSLSARLQTSLRVALLAAAATTVVLAQDPNAGGRRRGGDGADNGGRNFNPQDMQARMLTAMRERLEVPDDDEWKVISERIMKVMEIRRTTSGGMGGGFMFGRGGGPGGGGPGGGGDTAGRGGRGGNNTEAAALSAALRDKLPDAEIKSRLERLRDARKENEAKLAKAQEDLRAVLSIRQEAMAVVAGLLP